MTLFIEAQPSEPSERPDMATRWVNVGALISVEIRVVEWSAEAAGHRVPLKWVLVGFLPGHGGVTLMESSLPEPLAAFWRDCMEEIRAAR